MPKKKQLPISKTKKEKYLDAKKLGNTLYKGIKIEVANAPKLALEESVAARFAQVYDVIESIDHSSATRDKVNKVHDRVTALEDKVEEIQQAINAFLVALLIVGAGVSVGLILGLL